MKTDIYINKIIEGTGLTRKEIQDIVEDKKNELKGLISDEGALFIIAKELGVDVKSENKDFLKEIEIKISDITHNMKNIMLFGRIKDVYNVNKFKKKDGSDGYVGAFLLHDKSGDVRIVLWDEQVSIFNEPEFKNNELVKIVNGNAKKGKFGGTEIHIGRFGKLILSPDDVDYKNYPKIKVELIKIRDINLNLKSVSIEGKVIQIFPLKEFERKNGELGKVMSLTLLDSTGSVRIAFWNNDTDKLIGIESGDIISITNLTPKLSTLDSRTVDLNSSRSSKIEKKSKKLELDGDSIKNIKELQNRLGVVSFEGIITSIDNIKNISLKSGENVDLLGFTVSDNSDGIRVTLWREQAEEFSKILSDGQGIVLSNVLIKYSSFSNRNEISLMNDSTLELKNLEIKNLKSIIPVKRDLNTNFSGNYSKIGNINSPGIVEVKGFIAKDLTKITTYEGCTNCFKKVENCSCGQGDETKVRMIINLIVDDGTGTLRTTLIGDIAEKFIGVETEKISQIKETPEDFEKFLESKSSEILGKDIIIKGRAKFSDFSNSYELSAYDFRDVSINEELERAMKKIEG